MSRDMTLFVDDDQKAYHIYASEENQTLHIAELTDDYLGHNGRYVRILPGGHNEAPTVLKRNGKYFLITSGCTGWNPNAATPSGRNSLPGTCSCVLFQRDEVPHRGCSESRTGTVRISYRSQGRLFYTGAGQFTSRPHAPITAITCRSTRQARPGLAGCRQCPGHAGLRVEPRTTQDLAAVAASGLQPASAGCRPCHFRARPGNR